MLTDSDSSTVSSYEEEANSLNADKSHYFKKVSSSSDDHEASSDKDTASKRRTKFLQQRVNDRYDDASSYSMFSRRSGGFYVELMYWFLLCKNFLSALWVYYLVMLRTLIYAI